MLIDDINLFRASGFINPRTSFISVEITYVPNRGEITSTSERNKTKTRVAD